MGLTKLNGNEWRYVEHGDGGFVLVDIEATKEGLTISDESHLIPWSALSAARVEVGLPEWTDEEFTLWATEHGWTPPQPTTQCEFNEAWIGRCKERGDPYCTKHAGKVCSSCGEPANHNCDSTGQFVCGEFLCTKCEHTIFPDGTNGGVGFNAEDLPDGMKRHSRKDAQKYEPWYARKKASDDLPLEPIHCNTEGRGGEDDGDR